MIRMCRLTGSDFTALARGLGDRHVLTRLRTAEASKHLLLLRAVAEMAASGHADASAAAGLPAACDLIAAVQSQSPAAANEIIALPQVGSWAIGCLARMRGKRRGDLPLAAELGYLNNFAAAAAVRARYSFALRLPLNGGSLRLPGIGTASLKSGENRDWAAVEGVSHGDRMEISWNHDSVELPITATGAPAPGSGLNGSESGPASLWRTPYRLRSTVDGLSLDVALDDGDPFLDRYPWRPVSGMTAEDVAGWQRSFGEAWQILVRQHRDLAEPMTVGLHTIVPLSARSQGHRNSATSAVAFGAVATSLPVAGIALAETLVHEFQHVKLCALLDLLPLLGNGDDGHYYVPWRSDPRPLSGALQGAYAYLGVTRFWRARRLIPGTNHNLRAQVEFARWRTALPGALTTLIGSGQLTGAGRRFVSTMADELAAWQSDPIPPQAQALADEAIADHRLTWCVRHATADPGVVDRLATRWIAATSGDSDVAVAAAGEGGAQARADSGVPHEPNTRSRLLAWRYLDPARYLKWRETGRLGDDREDGTYLSPGDIALLHDDAAAAISAYRRHISAGQHGDAWVGLLLALRRTSPAATAEALLDKAALLIALHRRLRVLTGSAADPVELAAWLAGPAP